MLNGPAGLQNQVQPVTVCERGGDERAHQTERGQQTMKQREPVESCL